MWPGAKPDHKRERADLLVTGGLVLTQGFSSVSELCSWEDWPFSCGGFYGNVHRKDCIQATVHTCICMALCIYVIKDSIKCTKHTFMCIREVYIHSTNNSLHTFTNTFNKQIYWNNLRRTGPIFYLALSLSVVLWTCGLTSLASRSSLAEIQFHFELLSLPFSTYMTKVIRGKEN